MFNECRGFGPGRQATFVSAKVAKTIDTPSGLLGGEGRQPLKSGPTRRAQTRSATDKSVPPFGQPAGVGTEVKDGCETFMQEILGKGEEERNQGNDYS